jgi:hypothetical protein
MRRVAVSCSIAAVACLVSFTGSARAETRDDMCSPPKMATEKWKPRSEVGGMTILIPPGFIAGGHSAFQETEDTHFYSSGEHRTLAIGSGRGPAFVTHVSSVTESSECEAVLAGRRATITVYHWTAEDAVLSASGDAGSHFAAVARFYASGALREVYISLDSNAPSDLKYYRGIFWTVSFDGAPAAVAAAPAAAAVTTVAAQPTSTVVVGPVCSTALPPANLPAASTVIDSAIVGTLLASAAPIPSGFEVVRLQFDAGGELAGMNISQTDLPEASQRELAAVVGTNLKTHDSKAPPSIYLRIDSSATGLRYSVVPPPSC